MIWNGNLVTKPRAAWCDDGSRPFFIIFPCLICNMDGAPIEWLTFTSLVTSLFLCRAGAGHIKRTPMVGQWASEIKILAVIVFSAKNGITQ